MVGRVRKLLEMQVGDLPDADLSLEMAKQRMFRELGKSLLDDLCENGEAIVSALLTKSESRQNGRITMALAITIDRDGDDD